MVVFDLNGFKGINDRFGHAAGDRTLCDVAVCLRGVVGERGLCVRTGGDDRRRADPVRPSKRFETGSGGPARSRIAAAADRDGRALRPSLSAGVASAPDDGRTLEELLHAADERMFEAKRARQVRSGSGLVGRNA